MGGVTQRIEVEEGEAGYSPQILSGASSSSRMGWLRKISRDLMQRPRTSASVIWTIFPGRHPRTAAHRQHSLVHLGIDVEEEDVIWLIGSFICAANFMEKYRIFTTMRRYYLFLLHSQPCGLNGGAAFLCTFFHPLGGAVARIAKILSGI